MRLRLNFLDEKDQKLFPTFPREQLPIANGFLAWSADGRRLAAVSLPGQRGASIWIAQPDGPEPLRKLFDLPVSILPRGITWNKDGSGVIIAYQEPISDIVVFDLTN